MVVFVETNEVHRKWPQHQGGEGLEKKILQLGSEPVETDHETT